MLTRLADVAEVRTGFPFRGKVHDDPTGKLAVVQMKDVSDVGRLDPAACLHIQEESSHTRHLLRAGDVLLQSRGSKFPAGVVDMPIHGIAALGLHVLRPGPHVKPAYLAWIMNHTTTREALRDMARGSYIPFLSKGDLEELRVPVPDLATQQRIVEILWLRAEERRLHEQREALIDQLTWGAACATRD
ncbi:MAG: restriction endonuclease subunit S [Dehalococcoidia bacterium]